LQEKYEDEDYTILTCPLCEAGHRRPTEAPDLVGQKRKLGVIEEGGRDTVSGGVHAALRKKQETLPSRRVFVGRLPLTITSSTLRAALFYASSNNASSNNAVEENDNDEDDDSMRAVVENVHWIVDHTSGAFFGSAFVWMSTLERAQRLVEACGGERGERREREMLFISSSVASARRRERDGGKSNMKKKKKKRGKRQRRVPLVSFAPLKENVVWPVLGSKETEHPPR
jgi:hypothetical protein